jgi:hypothetical protein
MTISAKKLKVLQWLLVKKYRFIIISGIFLCALAFTITFLSVYVIEYSKCDGNLSFSHYGSIPLMIGEIKTISPTPMFECSNPLE